MLIVFAFFLIFVSVIAHEYGHYHFMRKYGMEIEEIEIGIPVRFLTLRIQHPRILSGTPLYLSPLLLRGCVRTKEGSSMYVLRPDYQLDISGAGIVMNIIFASFAVAISTPNPYYCFVAIVLGIVTFLGTKVLCRYIFPVLSFLFIAVLPLFLWQTLKLIPDGGHGTSVAFTEVYALLTTWREVGVLAALISLLLGIINLLPLYPMDGGRLVEVWLEKFLPEKVMDWYRSSTSYILNFALVVCTIDLVCTLFRIVWKWM